MNKSKTARWAIVCSILAGTLSQSLSAEPSAASSIAINSPITLMDWGMYQLQEALDKYHLTASYGGEEIRADGVFADYKFDMDKILIRALFLIDVTNRPPTESDLRQTCERVISEVRNLLGAQIHSKPEFWGKDYPSKFDFFFSHPGGFRRKAEPLDLGKQLENLTEIRIRLVTAVAQKSMDGKLGVPVAKDALMCRGPFLGEEILFNKLVPIEDAKGW